MVLVVPAPSMTAASLICAAAAFLSSSVPVVQGASFFRTDRADNLGTRTVPSFNAAASWLSVDQEILGDRSVDVVEHRVTARVAATEQPSVEGLGQRLWDAAASFFIPRIDPAAGAASLAATDSGLHMPHVVPHSNTDRCHNSTMIEERLGISPRALGVPEALQEEETRCSSDKRLNPPAQGDPNQERGKEFLENLTQRFVDLQVVTQVPTADQVGRWKNHVIVVEEGSFRHFPSNGGMTHWYNMVSMEIPTLLRYVLNPLRAANRTQDTTVVLPRESPRPCTTQVVGGASMTQECSSAFSTMPSLFPSYDIQFEDVPYCWSHFSCVLPANIPENLTKTATLLFIPQVFPMGAPDSPCARQSLVAIREWFLPSAGSTAQMGSLADARPSPRHVSLILRGMDSGTVSNKYHYERPVSLVPNMVELSQGVERWAVQKSLPFKQVQFEGMSLAEQVKAMQDTRILIGFEGAGLVNMVFFGDLTMSAVVELNTADGKTGNMNEFPIMAKRLGVPLWMHVFRCKFENFNETADPEALVSTLDDVLRVLS